MLGLTDHQMTDAGATALAESPHLGGLWRLDLVTTVKVPKRSVLDRLGALVQTIRPVGPPEPALTRVAITLARSGVGPPPADLVHSPGTVQELLNTADQPLDGLSNAVTAAGVAAGSLSATPRASVPRTTSGTPPAGGGRAPRCAICMN